MAIESQPIDRPRIVEEKSAVAARQGVISGRVVTVLLASFVLAVLALGISFWAVH